MKTAGCASPRPDFRSSMPWLPISLRRFKTSACAKPAPASRQNSGPKTLRRARYRDAAARSDAHHGQSALVGAVGPKPEKTIDAGKAGRIGQDLRREALRALGPPQRGDERDRV